MEDINKILNNIVNPNTVSVSNCVLFGFNTHIKDKEKYSNKLIIAEDNEILAECELSKRAYEVLNRSISETENGYKIALLRALKQLQGEEGKILTTNGNVNIKWKDSLQELQEKMSEDFEKEFFNEDKFDSSSFLHRNYQEGGGGRMLIDILDFLRQQTTLAYNTGKADMLDTVLKEIDEIRKPNIGTHVCLKNPTIGSITDDNGKEICIDQLPIYEYNKALDTLKTKLTAKEQIIR